MALLKDINQPTGFTTQYINIRRLISLVFGDDGASVEARLGMYRDEQARKDGSEPIEKDIRFDVDAQQKGLLLRVLYEAIREQYPDAANHIEADDPDLTGLVTSLENWELQMLHDGVEAEMTARDM